MDSLLTGKAAATKRDYWQSHIEAWQNSKLKQEAYCEREGIRYNTFVYWRGILLGKGVKKDKKTFLPIQIKVDKAPSSEPVPRAIQIKLLSGHVVYIPTSLEVDVIGKLILALGNNHA